MKTYEIITHEILTKIFRLDANSEEQAWDSDLYGEGVRLIKTERYDWWEEKEVNEVGEE